MDFKSEVAKQLEAFGLAYRGAQIDAFALFYERLIETNKVMNLTAITDPKEVAIKHIVDSLSAYDSRYFQAGSRLIDIGTGAGFPGIPLAIFDESLEVTLFDSLKKRLTFLEEVIGILHMEGRVKTLHGRAEDMAHKADYREAFHLGTSRAVARFPVLLEWSLPFVVEGGHFIALKGAAYEEEAQESQKALSTLGGKLLEVRPVKLPTIDDKRAVLVVKKEKATPQKYPRKPKVIKERPL